MERFRAIFYAYMSKDSQTTMSRYFVPDFSKVGHEDYLPSLDQQIEKAKKLIEGVTKSSDASFSQVFDNMERDLSPMSDLSLIFFNLLHAHTDEKLQSIAPEFSKKLTEFDNYVNTHPGMFALVENLYNKKDTLNLSSEQLRLLETTYKSFIRNGAKLNNDEQLQLKGIDSRLSELSIIFNDNVRKSTHEFILHIADEKQLSGIPEQFREIAKEDALSHDMKEGWVFTLQIPSYLPFMKFCDDEGFRQEMWESYSNIASEGEYDNTANLKEIVSLRQKRAKLLGYEDHNHYQLELTMAKDVKRVQEFMQQLVPGYRKIAQRELDEITNLKKKVTNDNNAKLMPWDVSYWSNKLRLEKYNFDMELLRPYFSSESVVNGFFQHANKLFGIQFKQLADVPTYHEDVQVYEVNEDGKHLGLLYVDLYPRASKSSGAWQYYFRKQGKILNEKSRPLVVVVCNFTKPTKDNPSLLSFDEVRTFFHECGHALHSLLSDCDYPSMSGTSVLQDFVELPSQIMENWILSKETLDLFAKHHETGEKIPEEYLEKIRKQELFMKGWQGLRQLSFATIDLAWHNSDDKSDVDILDFEKKIFAPFKLLDFEPKSAFSTQFTHIFAGGYSSGYYSYKWAEVLEADIFAMFEEQGLYNQTLGKQFREIILSKGNQQHPLELFKQMRGREPDIAPLLKREGVNP